MAALISSEIQTWISGAPRGVESVVECNGNGIVSREIIDEDIAVYFGLGETSDPWTFGASACW